MATRSSRADDLQVTQSFLDRLVDREPNLENDPFMTRAQSVRQLKASLRRDLEWLLNTRRIPDAAPPSLKDLAVSLYNYGLPDFSQANVRAPRDRNTLALEIERTVSRYEPRLKDVRVQIREEEDVNTATRTLSLSIEGMLQMDPAPEQISFDTLLELSSGEYQIRGERSA